MEEDIRKQGMLYLQQQRFGKVGTPPPPQRQRHRGSGSFASASARGSQSNRHVITFKRSLKAASPLGSEHSNKPVVSL